MTFIRRQLPWLSAGVALWLSMPPHNVWFLAPLGLVPLLWRPPAPWQQFCRSYLAYVLFFGLALPWIPGVLRQYGGLPLVVSWIPYLALVAYLALFPAVALAGGRYWQQRFRAPPLLAVPVAWVALEWLRGYLFTGFPWLLLGYAVHSQPLLRQAADIAGVYGLSFGIALVAVLLVGLAMDHSRRRWAWTTVLALLLGAWLAYGQGRYQTFAQQAANWQLGVVQPNISQHQKWNRAYRQQVLQQLIGLTQQLAPTSQGVIWPESAAPFYFAPEHPQARKVMALARRSQTPLLLGAPTREDGASGPRYYNSALAVDAAGQLRDAAHKSHLVPFGEYVPLGRYLPFIKRLAAGAGDFSPGPLKPLQWADHAVGPLICYEAIFPQLARQLGLQGSQLLVHLTNDAWFGRSAAPWQHLAMARLRAVENRLWLVRAANTGISAVVGPAGGLRQQTALFTPVALKGRIAWRQAQSCYQRWGDWLPAGCLLLSLAATVGARCSRRYSL